MNLYSLRRLSVVRPGRSREMRHLVCNDEVTTSAVDEGGGGDVAFRDHHERFHTGAVNLVSLIEGKIFEGKQFCSFEVFPVGDTSYEIFQRLFLELKTCSPLFYSVTWHAKADIQSHPCLKLFENLTNNTLFHLAAKGMNRQNVTDILNLAMSNGKTNIFALQGDSTLEGGDFPYAVDLVKFIRERFGSEFCICVAGYPQMHPKSPTKEIDLYYLKEKVDAGANFIITQLIFDSEVFINFVKDCRRVGIMVPIIPGVFPMPNFKSLLKMVNICKVRIPENFLNDLQSIKNNDEAVAEYGVELTAKIIKNILESGAANGFHMFTLNRSSLALEVCKRVGLY